MLSVNCKGQGGHFPPEGIKDTSYSPFFDRLREVSRLLPAEVGGVDILVYTPGEFAKMQKEDNAFAEMIVEEASLIYDGKTKI